MGERKVYSCDWCYVDAPEAGSVGSDWLVLHDGPNANRPHHLCGACAKARSDAIEQARVKCFTASRAAQPEGEAKR